MPCTMAILQGDGVSIKEIEFARGHVMQNIWPIHRAHAQTDTEELRNIEQMLESGDIQEPLMLYPQQLDIVQWYYQIFYTTRKEEHREQNKIVTTLFPNKDVQGDVAIVRNRSGFNLRDQKWDIDGVELGKTLWWNLKTEQDATRIANQ